MWRTTPGEGTLTRSTPSAAFHDVLGDRVFLSEARAAKPLTVLSSPYPVSD